MYKYLSVKDLNQIQSSIIFYDRLIFYLKQINIFISKIKCIVFLEK